MDVIAIGKLRRPRRASAYILFDPSHGIRIEGEGVPPAPAAAAAWCRTAGGWVRIYATAKQSSYMGVADFIEATRRGE